LSRHARLTPSMSALVIKSHVTEGLELAKKEKLPPGRRLRHSGAPRHDHHGVLLRQGAEQDPTTSDHDYRYPGPRPQSKETAIVMLADSIEGASRSLQQPTPARLRGLVNKIVDQRLHEGQLDECGLSLADVARIREAFLQVLTGIFHVRVAYPSCPDGRAMPITLATPARGPDALPAPARARLVAYARRVAPGAGRDARGRHDRARRRRAAALALRALHRARTARPTCSRSRSRTRPGRVAGARSKGRFTSPTAGCFAQAKRYRHSPGRELVRLVTHGLLHLAGHDHMKPGERRIMRAAERAAERDGLMPKDRAAFEAVARVVRP